MVEGGQGIRNKARLRNSAPTAARTCTESVSLTLQAWLETVCNIKQVKDIGAGYRTKVHALIHTRALLR
jgi:hypothetical protein